MTEIETLLRKLQAKIEQMGNGVISGEDLYQEVSVAVLKSPSKWAKGNPHREKQILRIAANIKNTMWRKFYRRQRIAKDLTDQRGGDFKTGDAAGELSELKEALKKATADLKSDEQAILKFRFEDNMSLAAIASMQGRPESSIRSRFRRSLQKLALHEGLSEEYRRN